MDVVERYLAAITGHDWDALGACLSDDVVRVGPYGDTYRGRDEYVAFLQAVLPALPGYSMHVDRVRATADRRVVVVELAETVRVGDADRRTPEALVFDLDERTGLITRIAVYVQNLDEPVPPLARH